MTFHISYHFVNDIEMEKTGLCGENSFMWLSTVTVGRLLRAFKFHEMWRIPLLNWDCDHGITNFNTYGNPQDITRTRPQLWFR
jgi:hypothetical protein